MAILSIETKLHGRDLDRVYGLVASLLPTTDVRSAPSTRKLHQLETASLHPGLRFTQQRMSIDFSTTLPMHIKQSLSHVTLTIREDMSIVIAEMMTRHCTYPHVTWQYKEQRDSSGDRVFSAFYTADCWKEFENSVTAGICNKKMAAILLFSDSTTILKHGNKSLHPIYMCPAGLSYEHMGVHYDSTWVCAGCP